MILLTIEINAYNDVLNELNKLPNDRPNNYNPKKNHGNNIQKLLEAASMINNDAFKDFEELFDVIVDINESKDILSGVTLSIRENKWKKQQFRSKKNFTKLYLLSEQIKCIKNPFPCNTVLHELWSSIWNDYVSGIVYIEYFIVYSIYIYILYRKKN